MKTDKYINLSGKIMKHCILKFLLLFIFSISSLFSMDSGKIAAQFVNVGQGSFTILQFKEGNNKRVMVVDAGSSDYKAPLNYVPSELTSENKPTEDDENFTISISADALEIKTKNDFNPQDIVKHRLQNQTSDNVIKTVVVSHPDKDHYSWVQHILSQFTVGNIVLGGLPHHYDADLINEIIKHRNINIICPVFSNKTMNKENLEKHIFELIIHENHITKLPKTSVNFLFEILKIIEENDGKIGNKECWGEFIDYLWKLHHYNKNTTQPNVEDSKIKYIWRNYNKTDKKLKEILKIIKNINKIIFTIFQDPVCKDNIQLSRLLKLALELYKRGYGDSECIQQIFSSSNSDYVEFGQPLYAPYTPILAKEDNAAFLDFGNPFQVQLLGLNSTHIANSTQQIARLSSPIDSNNDSIIVRAMVNNESILIMGDATKGVTDRLLLSVEPQNLHSTIYHAAHHGGIHNGENDLRFLEIVAPQLIVCSHGLNQGHPNPETYNNFKLLPTLAPILHEQNHYYHPVFVGGKATKKDRSNYTVHYTSLGIFSTMSNGTIKVNLPNKNNHLSLDIEKPTSLSLKALLSEQEVKEDIPPVTDTSPEGITSFIERLLNESLDDEIINKLKFTDHTSQNRITNMVKVAKRIKDRREGIDIEALMTELLYELKNNADWTIQDINNSLFSKIYSYGEVHEKITRDMIAILFRLHYGVTQFARFYEDKKQNLSKEELITLTGIPIEKIEKLMHKLLMQSTLPSILCWKLMDHMKVEDNDENSKLYFNLSENFIENVQNKDLNDTLNLFTQIVLEPINFDKTYPKENKFKFMAYILDSFIKAVTEDTSLNYTYVINLAGFSKYARELIQFSKNQKQQK